MIGLLPVAYIALFAEERCPCDQAVPEAVSGWASNSLGLEL